MRFARLGLNNEEKVEHKKSPANNSLPGHGLLVSLDVHGLVE